MNDFQLNFSKMVDVVKANLVQGLIDIISWSWRSLGIMGCVKRPLQLINELLLGLVKHQECWYGSITKKIEFITHIIRLPQKFVSYPEVTILFLPDNNISLRKVTLILKIAKIM